jgi:hypothetical protein
MSGYLRWIAQRYGDLQAARPQEHALLRARAVAEDDKDDKDNKGRHARNPDIVASLAWGWQCFLNFARDVGAISQAERDTLPGRVWRGLREAAQEQTLELAARDPVRRFLELLAAAIASGRAHVCGPEGQAPNPDPASWGWRFESHGAGQFATGGWHAQGNGVGWLEGDDLYLDPVAAYAAAQQMGTAGGDGVGVSKDQLQRRLKDARLLTLSDDDRTTMRRRLQGQRRSVLKMHRDSLFPQDLTVQTVNTVPTVPILAETVPGTSQGED